MDKTATLQKYEESFAERMGRRHAYSFWKGRVAAYAMFKALGVGEGDEVILPGYTCVMAVNPIVYLGAKPVFVDIDPVTYNIDPSLVEEKITPRTKVIVAQHTYGFPVDMDLILDIANRKGIPVVEDCCLSLGSEYDGKLTGTFGVAAYFSFQWNKPYTSGIGGMTVTDDGELAAAIAKCQEQAVVPGFKPVMMLRMQLAVYRSLIYPRTTAFAQNVFRAMTRMGLVVGSSSCQEFEPKMPEGFLTGMSKMQAKAGSRQLHYLDRNILHRKHMTKVYECLLAERGWDVPSIPEKMNPSLVRFPVRVRDKDKALASAARHFVELGSWFECPLHPIETPMAAYGYHSGMCPEADRASREVVNLPVHPRTNESTAKRSVEFVSSIGLV